MPEDKKTEKQESPAGEIILALQNRINDLEAKLQELTKTSTKSYVDQPFLENKIAELRAEIAELRAEKKAVIKEEKEIKKEIREGENVASDKSNGQRLAEYLFDW